MSNLEASVARPDAAPASGPPSKKTGRAWWARLLWGVALAPSFALSGVVFFFVTMAFGLCCWLRFGFEGVYDASFAFLENHPVVVAELGPPVRGDWLPTGKARTQGDSGEARLSIELSGRRGDGLATVHSRRQQGTWVVEEATLWVDGVEHTLSAKAAPIAARDAGGAR